jgi:hypothetical protein
MLLPAVIRHRAAGILLTRLLMTLHGLALPASGALICRSTASKRQGSTMWLLIGKSCLQPHRGSAAVWR